MITRVLGQQLLFTQFLISRDCLSTCFSRMGSGFTPPTVLADAKYRIKEIQELLNKMEQIAEVPKEAIVAQDYKQLIQRNCCGRD
jgi:hypothetical protein